MSVSPDPALMLCGWSGPLGRARGKPRLGQVTCPSPCGAGPVGSRRDHADSFSAMGLGHPLLSPPRPPEASHPRPGPRPVPPGPIDTQGAFGSPHPPPPTPAPRNLAADKAAIGAGRTVGQPAWPGLYSDLFAHPKALCVEVKLPLMQSPLSTKTPPPIKKQNQTTKPTSRPVPIFFDPLEPEREPPPPLERAERA